MPVVANAEIGRGARSAVPKLRADDHVAAEMRLREALDVCLRHQSAGDEVDPGCDEQRAGQLSEFGGDGRKPVGGVRRSRCNRRVTDELAVPFQDEARVADRDGAMVYMRLRQLMAQRRKQCARLGPVVISPRGI